MPIMLLLPFNESHGPRYANDHDALKKSDLFLAVLAQIKKLINFWVIFLETESKTQ